MAKQDGNARSPALDNIPKRVILIRSHDPATNLSPVRFPGMPSAISVPYNRVFENLGSTLSHIAIGHIMRPLEAETPAEVKSALFRIGALFRISTTAKSGKVFTFSAEPGMRVKLLDLELRGNIFLTRWENIHEVTPSEEEFHSEIFLERIAKLKEVDSGLPVTTAGEGLPRYLDINHITHESIVRFVDSWAHIFNPFIADVKIAYYLRSILAEANVGLRVDLLIELMEYVAENGSVVAKSLRQKTAPKSGDQYEERYEEIRERLTGEARQEIEDLIIRSNRQAHPSELAAVKEQLERILSLPWDVYTEDTEDIARIRGILDEDHWGLAKIKKRILEFIAVRQLNPSGKAPIWCFVGPPGVGKTSLGESIARALNRKFTRLSLGGMTDEAEIRGHRATYMNALMGQVMDGIRKCRSANPVFMLDEIDKVGKDWKGDPEAALLEVLDPEQNKAFRDRYLNVPFDLSRTLFITTANVAGTIRPALRDRMEFLELPGYTPLEKVQIAQRHLIPKRRSQNGFPVIREGKNPVDITLSDDTLLKLIHSYTDEAGVRNLERQIDRPFRKTALVLREGTNLSLATIEISEQDLQDYCGDPEISERFSPTTLPAGTVPILAVSDSGGHVFLVEININQHPGGRKLVITGVRKSDEAKDAVNRIEESLKIAWDAMTSRGKILFERVRQLEKSLGPLIISCNITNGAEPKDGPSAGLSIWIALYGALTGQSVKPTPETPLLATTGEITASLDIIGEIGGVRDKILAAHRFGARRIIIPGSNQRHIKDVPREILDVVEITTETSMLKALACAYPDDEGIKQFMEKRKIQSS